MKRPRGLCWKKKTHPKSEQKAATPKNGVIKFTCEHCACKSVFLISPLPWRRGRAARTLPSLFLASSYPTVPEILPQTLIHPYPGRGPSSAGLSPRARLRSLAETSRVPLYPLSPEEGSGRHSELPTWLVLVPLASSPIIFSFPSKFLCLIPTPIASRRVPNIGQFAVPLRFSLRSTNSGGDLALHCNCLRTGWTGLFAIQLFAQRSLELVLVFFFLMKRLFK